MSLLDGNTMVARAETAAALAMRDPSQTRNAFRIYLAEMVSGAIGKKQQYAGVRVGVTITRGDANACVCSVTTGDAEKPAQFKAETLTEVVEQRNAAYLNGEADAQINYAKIFKDFEVFQKRMSATIKEEKTQSGIIIARK